MDKYLLQLICSNFVAYHNAHAAHLNTQGTNFVSDHALMEEIYSFLWEYYDTLSELLRQCDKQTPAKLSDILKLSSINEAKFGNSSSVLFGGISVDLETLKEQGQAAYDAAGKEGYGGAETVIGDYLAGVNKLHWKVKAVLGRSFK